MVGISGAMEEENAKNKEFDANSINAVKSSLMGPVSGIGDSFSGNIKAYSSWGWYSFSFSG